MTLVWGPDVNLDDLDKIIEQSTTSAFRLETLPQYLVPQPNGGYTAWREAKPLAPRTPETLPWMAEMKRQIDAGYRQYRVHIVDYPLSDYTRYELLAYLDNQAVGEEIHIAERDAHSELRDLHEDFWLYDDEIAVRMIYDDKGHFLYPEMIGDVRPYRIMRDTAMRHAEPLDDYLARVKPKLTI